MVKYLYTLTSSDEVVLALCQMVGNALHLPYHRRAFHRHY